MNLNFWPKMYGAGGGGGAGAVGQDASTVNGSGCGGMGIQLPSTFRNPANLIGYPGPTSAPGPTFDTSGNFWVAGGGGGAGNPPLGNPTSYGVGGAYNGSSIIAGGPWAGAGDQALNPFPNNAIAEAGSGSGGGGASGYPGAGNAPQGAGNGGSGLVLIAYPA